MTTVEFNCTDVTKVEVPSIQEGSAIYKLWINIADDIDRYGEISIRLYNHNKTLHSFIYGNTFSHGSYEFQGGIILSDLTKIKLISTLDTPLECIFSIYHI